jgi:hypothetical protein
MEVIAWNYVLGTFASCSSVQLKKIALHTFVNSMLKHDTSHFQLRLAQIIMSGA